MICDQGDTQLPLRNRTIPPPPSATTAIKATVHARGNEPVVYNTGGSVYASTGNGEGVGCGVTVGGSVVTIAISSIGSSMPMISSL